MREVTDPELLDRVCRGAAESLLRAMFMTEIRGQVDLLTDEGARAYAVRLILRPEQAKHLAHRLGELGPPRGLVLRNLSLG